MTFNGQYIDVLTKESLNYFIIGQTFSVDNDRNFSYFTVIFFQFVDQLLSLFGTDFIREYWLVLDRHLVEDWQTYCR